jgi:hypothetical protein
MEVCHNTHTILYLIDLDITLVLYIPKLFNKLDTTRVGLVKRSGNTSVLVIFNSISSKLIFAMGSK